MTGTKPYDVCAHGLSRWEACAPCHRGAMGAAVEPEQPTCPRGGCGERCCSFCRGEVTCSQLFCGLCDKTTNMPAGSYRTDTIPDDATYDPNTDQWMRPSTTNDAPGHASVATALWEAGRDHEQARIERDVRAVYAKWPGASAALRDEVIAAIRGGDDA